MVAWTGAGLMVFLGIWYFLDEYLGMGPDAHMSEFLFYASPLLLVFGSLFSLIAVLMRNGGLLDNKMVHTINFAPK